VLTSLFIATLIIVILLENYWIALSAFGTFFALSTALLTNVNLDDPEKNRPSAMIRSFVPGLAHIYLHAYRRAMVFSFGYLMVVLAVLGMIMTAPNGLPSFFAIFCILFGMIFISLMDTEMVCNKIGLPYTGYPYEMKIKNYNLAFFVTLSIVCICGAITPAYEMLYADTVDNIVNMIILAASLTALTVSFVVFIVSRKIPNNSMI